MPDLTPMPEAWPGFDADTSAGGFVVTTSASPSASPVTMKLNRLAVAPDVAIRERST